MFLNGGGCGPLLQPLLEREEDACCDKDCNGFMGVSRGITRVVRSSNKKGLEGEHGWEKPYCKRQKGLARLVEWVSDIRNIPVRIFRLA